MIKTPGSGCGRVVSVGGGTMSERTLSRRAMSATACAAPSGTGSLERFPQVRVRKASHRRLELLIEAAVANER